MFLSIPVQMLFRSMMVIFSGIERSAVEDEFETKSSESNVCSRLKLPMTVQTIKGEKYYNTSFAVYVASKEEEGLYNLYFHNCPNYKYDSPVALDFTVRHLFRNNLNNFSLYLVLMISHLQIQISEINSGNFLSAGEMPLPALYFMMALLFFLSGCFWVFILRKSK